MASDASGSGVAEMFTVNVAVPVTTVPSGLEATDVITVVPLVRAVATPVAELIVATEATLELHVAALIVAEPIVADIFVRFTVVPLAVVPMAMSPAV
jgi:hypothetical protein